MISTAVVTDVDSLISHYDRKSGGVRRPTRSGPTVRSTQSEQMERISSGEKTCDRCDYHYRG